MKYVKTYESFLFESALNSFISDVEKEGSLIKSPIKSKSSFDTPVTSIVFETKGVVQLKPLMDNRVWLEKLYSLQKGGGSYVMNRIISLADKHGIQLELSAKPFDAEDEPMLLQIGVPKNVNPLSEQNLISFYKKFGFEITELPGVFVKNAMKRIPQ
jgi:hypothetical protein